MLAVCYPKCSTCRKALKWLEERNIPYDYRDISVNNPTRIEIEEWYKKSGLPLKRFYNTSGNLYKSMHLKEKLPDMSEEEQLDLLSTDGMLIKRPIIVKDDTVLVGFRSDEWEKIFSH